MKVFVFGILLIVIASGCLQQPLIGGDTDEHGCLPAAGYTWCEAKQKCLREWEEQCKTGFSADECEDAGGNVVSAEEGEGCDADEESIGQVLEMGEPGVCCVLLGELCTAPGGERMVIDEAMGIAEQSECTSEGELVDEYSCNESTGTWWIDLDLEKEGCAPACVVNVTTGEAQINWRCTGALN